MGNYLCFTNKEHHYAVEQEHIEQIIVMQQELVKVPLCTNLCHEMVFMNQQGYACIDVENLFFQKKCDARYLLLLREPKAALLVETLLEPVYMADTCWAASSWDATIWSYEEKEIIYLIDAATLLKKVIKDDSHYG